MCESVGKLIVVGENDKAGGVGIESAGTEDAVGRWYEVDGLCASVWVRVGANDAFGFIEQEIYLWLTFDFLSVN